MFILNPYPLRARSTAGSPISSSFARVRTCPAATDRTQESLLDAWISDGLRSSINDQTTHLELGTAELPLSSDAVLTLCLPKDVDSVMDMYICENREDRDPYWSRPWPSAVALATVISRRPDLVEGKRVLDLGCGLGVAGLAAALGGAKEVVMADREPLALQCGTTGG